MVRFLQKFKEVLLPVLRVIFFPYEVFFGRYRKSFEIIDVSLEHETDKAMLVKTQEGFTAWLPKSQVQVLEQKGRELRLKIPEWLFDEKLK